MIYYKKNPLNGYAIFHGEEPSAKTAADILRCYLAKLCGEVKGKDLHFCLSVSQEVDDEYFYISNREGDIKIVGGKRGIIYGVYEFLERYCGCRFFAYDSEYTPSIESKIEIDEDIYLEENSVIKFREILGNSSGENADTWLKLRLNSNAWNERLLEEHGGGYSYAGIPAHSLTGEFLLKDYIDSNPEYFSFDGEKRLTDRMGQICFSADGVVDVIAKEVKKCLEKQPNASFISLTPGDNGNYCQCAGCKKLYERYSLSDCFLNIINDVAKRIKKDYPKVFVHGFAYEMTIEASGAIRLEDNVIMQYCIGSCKNHAINDKNCPYNEKFEKILSDWAKVAKNLLIWDYPNAFKYQIFNLPALKYMRENYRFFADHHVVGVFNEYVHRFYDGACQFAELKTYLHSKLMWNPYMSEEEYKRHYQEFMRHYYGAAATPLMKYIEFYEGSLNPDKHYNYDLTLPGNRAVGVLDEDLISPEKRDELVRYGEELWTEALRLTEGMERERVECESIQFLWLKQILTFDKIMQNGTQEDREKALQINRELIDLIKKHNIKLTFWGQTVEMQNAEIDEYANCSPLQWNYKW